jgi:hypothetical protein
MPDFFDTKLSFGFELLNPPGIPENFRNPLLIKYLNIYYPDTEKYALKNNPFRWTY